MLFFVFILAFLLVLPFGASLLEHERESTGDSESAFSEASQDVSEAFVLVKKDGIICQMTVEDWTLYALNYELPQNSPEEFAKAMAVAMRTYAAYHIWHGDKTSDHPECTFCSDPSHCKGLDSDNIEPTVRDAVLTTSGEIIYYNRFPINPIMHISSSVMTECATEVLGYDVPYLQSASTPDESGLKDFLAVRSFTETKIKDILKANGYETSGECTNWITYVSYTAAGRVRSISLCGQTISGSELMAMLNLPSLNFTVKASSDKLVFETEGIGSGLGMSEYGAYIMAKSGFNYEQILTHYYSNTYIV